MQPPTLGNSFAARPLAKNKFLDTTTANLDRKDHLQTPKKGMAIHNLGAHASWKYSQPGTSQASDFIEGKNPF